jgi:hypothetical protein
VEDVTIETAKAYEDVARHISHCSEFEQVIIFGIRGQRTPGCDRECKGCYHYPECFPETSKYVKEQWARLMTQLVNDEEVR